MSNGQFQSTQSLRILQVVNVRWFNATSWYALFLAKLLRQAGHDCRVIVLPGTETWKKAEEWRLSPLTLNLNSRNPAAMAATAFQLQKLLGKFKPHVVNCHRGESFFLWAALRRINQNFALVRTRGDRRLPRHDILNRCLHNRVADGIICTNSDMRRYFLAQMGTAPAHIQMILGGVDQDYFRFDPQGRAAVRREFGFADTETVLGLLGRLDTVKDQRGLIAACAKLRRAGRRLKLLLVGAPTSPSSLAQVHGWLKEAGLAQLAVVTGRRNDVPACISAMDIGVVASLGSEAIARAALEIMACRRPLLGTPVGVMPDLLPRAALFAPGNPEAMAEAIARIMDDRAFSQYLLANAAERLPALSGPAFAEQTLAAYGQAIRQAGLGLDA